MMAVLYELPAISRAHPSWKVAGKKLTIFGICIFYMQFSFTSFALFLLYAPTTWTRIKPIADTHTQRHNAGIQYSSGGCRVYIQTLVHMNFIITIYTWFLFADNEENCEFSNVMKINCDMTLYLQFFICLSEWTFNRLISGCSFVPQRVGAVGGIGQRNAHLR